MNPDDHYQLVLWPRGHQKSTLIAYWAAWTIVRDPTVSILYASATAPLTEKQVGFIQDILTSPAVRKYWPDLIKEREAEREMWRNLMFTVDHPIRSEKSHIADPTIKGVGINMNATGFHADKIILDDLVIRENAYTETGRKEVEAAYSLFNSVLNPNGYVKAVGTRYHDQDLYSKLLAMTWDDEDEQGNITEGIPVYNVMAAVVEQDGNFLWPRQQRYDGKYFGFNKRVLSRIKANYLDKSQYFAQYYNDPTDPENKRIDNFVYYKPELLNQRGGKWHIGSEVLNIFAAIDIAATVTARADYTAIAVAGITAAHNIYVLDLVRFKTDKISMMGEHLFKLYNKWNFLKLRAECNAQQNLAIEGIKQFNYERNIYYTVDSQPSVINKYVRIMAALEPRYAAGKIHHFKGGTCEILERELMATKPPHDDVSDALAACVDVMVAPTRRKVTDRGIISYHPKFGGVL
jgi:hypothetical protein